MTQNHSRTTETQATVQLDGCEVSYERVGSGPTVILIHGLGGTKAIWRRLRERLAADFDVLAYDLRASGATRETVGGRDLSLTTWSDDLRGLVEALRLSRPALVGHSLGASIAVKYALRWPHDVSALVLMGADADLSRLAPRLNRVVELIERVGLEEWVDEHWSKNTPFSAASLARTPEILAEYRSMVLANDPESYTRTCLAIAQMEDLRDALAGVAQPALVIAGMHDDRTLPDAGRELAGAFRNGALLELEGVGHTLPLEAPQTVGSAIVEFLASADGGGTLGRPAP